MRALSVVVMVMVLTAVIARRPWKQRQNRLRCKYDKGDWGACDLETNTRTRVLTLRDGEEGCQATQNQTISCEKFQRIQEWKSKKMERKTQRQEAKLQRRQEKQEIGERIKLLKEQRKRCQYEYSDWSECDNSTNTMSRTLTLTQDQEGCEQTQTVTISCKRFERKQAHRAMKMERKNQRQEQKLLMKEQKKEMKQRKKMLKEQMMNCKYDKGDWSECDNTTNTVTRVLTLRDTEEGCEPKLDVTISCAKYERIQSWKAKKMERRNEKKEGKLQRKEMKNLFKENRNFIKEQRMIGCSFDVAFSECDATTQMVTKTYIPVEDDESCERRTVSYSCQLHEQLMERKMKKQEKRNERKRQRMESKLQRLNRKLGRL